MVFTCDEVDNSQSVGNKIFWKLANHSFKNSSLVPQMRFSEQQPLLSLAQFSIMLIHCCNAVCVKSEYSKPTSIALKNGW